MHERSFRAPTEGPPDVSARFPPARSAQASR
jgi:hypothetical protein